MSNLFDKLWEHTPQGKQQHNEAEEHIAQGTASYIAHQETLRLTKDVRKKYNHMMLMNQAMWEILEEKLGVTKKQLADKMTEIDMRDGELNGKMVQEAPDCPQCGAKICVEVGHCQFCGYQPEGNSNLFEPML